MSLINFDLKKISYFIIDIANNEIVSRFNKLKNRDIWKKLGNEDVSITDIKVQEKLIRILSDITPGSHFLSEELCKNPNNLSHYLQTDLLWILDPLDGTSNFIKGDKNCGINLALAYKGKIIAAWIYAPFKKKLIEAELGAGVYLNNNRYIPAKNKKEEINEFSGVLAIGDFPISLQQHIIKTSNKLAFYRKTKACCIDYLEILENKIDFLLYLRTYPWDHSAGTFILNEANFFCNSWIEGKKYSYLEAYSGLLVAKNFIMWDKLRSFFHLNITLPELRDHCKLEECHNEH